MTGNRTTLVKLASTVAIAAVLLSGCASDGGARPSSYAAKPLAGGGNQLVAKAERAVLAAPRDAAARAALGAAYLSAGRFASAAQSYDDALNLGDESATTVLGLALAETANGNAPAARELLHDWRDVIPAGDLGLAFALAGETSRGVQVLSDALRNGEVSAKARQNLAYAYALDGRWREARLMVSQDIPADQVDARLGEWATMGRAEHVTFRVAHLLGVTAVADQGQPQALALGNFPSTEQLAAEASGQVVAAAEPVAPMVEAVAHAAAPVAMAQAELSPVAAPAALAQVDYVVVPAPGADAPVVATSTARSAVAAPVAQPITLAAFERAGPAVANDGPSFSVVSAPAAPSVKPRIVGKAMRTKFASDPRNIAQPGKGKGLSAMLPLPKVVAGGSHWLQLGSYTDPAIAKDGWRKFTSRTPALKHYRTVTTTATVDGTPVWRVAAAGFPSYAEAARMCAKVKGRGGACLVKRAETAAVASAGSPVRGLRR